MLAKEDNMKKLLAILFVGVITLSLAACDLKGITDGEPLDYDATMIEENVDTYLVDEGFLVELSVSVVEAGEQGEPQTVVYAQKGEVFYYSILGEEFIIDFSDPAKATAYLKAEGVWFKHVDEYTETLKREDIEASYGNYTETIFEYFGMYSDFSGMLMEKTECEVAGRACDKFTVSIGILEFGIGYSFCIDKQTGMCLEWQLNAAAGEGTESGISFMCNRFETPYEIAIPADAIDGDIDLGDIDIVLPTP